MVGFVSLYGVAAAMCEIVVERLSLGLNCVLELRDSTFGLVSKPVEANVVGRQRSSMSWAI